MDFARWLAGKHKEHPVERKIVIDRPCRAMQDALPQPVEDEVIRDELYNIFESVEEHINTYYTPGAPFAAMRLAKIDSRRDLYAEVNRLPDCVHHRPTETIHPLAQKFPDETALRLWMKTFLARLLVTAISPFDNEEDSGSLLPDEILDFLGAVQTPDRLTGDAGYQSVFGHWKALSLYLLNHPSMKEDNRKENERRYQESQSSIIGEVDSEFESLYDPNNAKRTKHLKQILRDTTELGRILWSQVAQYQFDWGMDLNHDRGLSTSTTVIGRRRKRTRTREGDAKKRRGSMRPPPNDRLSTLYMPGLIKVSDQYGRILDPVKCVLEPRREDRPARSRRATGTLIDV